MFHNIVIIHLLIMFFECGVVVIPAYLCVFTVKQTYSITLYLKPTCPCQQSCVRLLYTLWNTIHRLIVKCTIWTLYFYLFCLPWLWLLSYRFHIIIIIIKRFVYSTVCVLMFCIGHTIHTKYVYNVQPCPNVLYPPIPTSENIKHYSVIYSIKSEQKKSKQFALLSVC